VNLSDIAVMTTACKRPYYFRETIGHWERARGISEIQGFYVALGQSDRHQEMTGVLQSSKMMHKPGITVRPDPLPGMGMHRAIGDMGEALFNPDFSWLPEPKFVIFGEEDVLVSDDVLEYFLWAANEFEHDRTAGAVCAHNRGGQYWDAHEPARDEDADQWQARVAEYFNAWCWGTWVDRWAMFHDNWDWDCTSGNATGEHSGWDWNIATRILPRNYKVCIVPDASRSQNIGRLEGWASSDWSFSFSQAQSFRPHREPGEYRIVS
jgi:hypothetical protein